MRVSVSQILIYLIFEENQTILCKTLHDKITVFGSDCYDTLVPEFKVPFILF